MKKNKKKLQRYGILKLILRILTLGIAILSLIISLQNKKDIEWLNDVQMNVIEKVLFKDIDITE